jgi:eukaryotic-like serine/threonine-protein kinase
MTSATGRELVAGSSDKVLKGPFVPLELPGYRITRQVGTGAASKIFHAIEASTGRSVAIKHVIRNGPDDDRFFEQAETEYLVSNTVEHPSLRKTHSIQRIRKLLKVSELMLVMEYVDGLHIEKARPNRLNTFIKLFARVAHGLDALHEAGFVHSDIKPTNIMVAPGGVVKIIDFGQCGKMNQSKERIQGTPDYIAPEQVRRTPLDRRTDVFNLGATMYWVLTSEKYPTELRGHDGRGGINIITSNKPIAPNELNDKIPLSLSKLVMECCSDNPDERPADMKQVVARLAVVQKLWQKYLDSLRNNRDADMLPQSDGTTSAEEVQERQ